jgi:hypothetical protein
MDETVGDGRRFATGPHHAGRGRCHARIILVDRPSKAEYGDTGPNRCIQSKIAGGFGRFYDLGSRDGNRAAVRRRPGVTSAWAVLGRFRSPFRSTADRASDQKVWKRGAHHVACDALKVNVRPDID